MGDCCGRVGSPRNHNLVFVVRNSKRDVDIAVTYLYIPGNAGFGSQQVFRRSLCGTRHRDPLPLHLVIRTCLRLAHSDELRNVPFYPGLTQSKQKRLESAGNTAGTRKTAEDKRDRKGKGGHSSTLGTTVKQPCVARWWRTEKDLCVSSHVRKRIFFQKTMKPRRKPRSKKKGSTSTTSK